MAVESCQRLNSPPCDQNVDIAVRSHLAPRRRAEEDDPLRLRQLDDTPNDFGQERFVRMPSSRRRTGLVEALTHPSSIASVATSETCASLRDAAIVYIKMIDIARRVYHEREWHRQNLQTRAQPSGSSAVGVSLTWRPWSSGASKAAFYLSRL